MHPFIPHIHHPHDALRPFSFLLAFLQPNQQIQNYFISAMYDYSAINRKPGSVDVRDFRVWEQGGEKHPFHLIRLALGRRFFHTFFGHLTHLLTRPDDRPNSGSKLQKYLTMYD